MLHLTCHINQYVCNTLRNFDLLLMRSDLILCEERVCWPPSLHITPAHISGKYLSTETVRSHSDIFRITNAMHFHVQSSPELSVQLSRTHPSGSEVVQLCAGGRRANRDQKVIPESF